MDKLLKSNRDWSVVVIAVGDTACPKCGGGLKYYDKVWRTLQTGNGNKTRITIRRFRCEKCGAIHREMPDSVIPHKHYGADVIAGVLNGTITPDILEYEDFPCETTMERWKKE